MNVGKKPLYCAAESEWPCKLWRKVKLWPVLLQISGSTPSPASAWWTNNSTDLFYGCCIKKLYKAFLKAKLILLKSGPVLLLGHHWPTLELLWLITSHHFIRSDLQLNLMILLSLVSLCHSQLQVSRFSHDDMSPLHWLQHCHQLLQHTIKTFTNQPSLHNCDWLNVLIHIFRVQK